MEQKDASVLFCPVTEKASGKDFFEFVVLSLEGAFVVVNFEPQMRMSGGAQPKRSCMYCRIARTGCSPRMR